MKPLILDGEDHPTASRDLTPTTFNVIETGYLIDQVGLLNLLPNLVKALDAPASFLYTSTRLEKVSDERNMMEKLLCGDVSVMCALLGLVPSAYLSGHAFHPFNEYLDFRPLAIRPITNRIVWVPTVSTDSKVELGCTNIVGEEEGMIKFLANVYINMFSHETNPESYPSHWYKYTRHSFVTLLLFLKERVKGIDWTDCVAVAIATLHSDKKSHALICKYRAELVVLCRLHGLLSTTTLIEESRLPFPMVFLLTVPRSIINQSGTVYDKLSSSNLPVSFQIHIKCGKRKDNGEHNKITAVQYCFGKLTSTSPFGPEIEEDRAGWKGTGDLHVWGFGCTEMGDGNKVRSLDAILALTPEKELLKLLRSDLGDSLSVFKVNSRRDHHLFTMAGNPPNLRRPEVPKTASESSVAGGEIAKRNKSFVIKFPILDIDNQHFTTRIEVLGDSLERLQKKEIISIDQSSTCTLTVKFGEIQVSCNYAFPVDYRTTKLRLSRAQGLIEVTAPLLTPSRRGHFCLNPCPVLSGPDSQITNCFSPYINFCQLPQLDRRLAHADMASSTRVGTWSSVPDHLAANMYDVHRGATE